MPYIKESTLRKIYSQIKIETVPPHFFETMGQVWWRVISQLSISETRELLLWKAIYGKPGYIVGIYQKSDKVDTYRYLNEAKSSSYHKDEDCPNLHAGFVTFKVPTYIVNQGKLVVVSFREWYKSNINRLGGVDSFDNHTPQFYQEMWDIFGDDPDKETLKKEDVPGNDKNGNKDNLSLPELEYYINTLIDDLWKFYQNQNAKTQEVLRLFGRSSKFGFSSGHLKDNPTDFSEERIKSFLKEYHNKFKQPLLDSLRDYYRIYFNEKLDYKGSLLESLNIKPCRRCYSSTYKM